MEEPKKIIKYTPAPIFDGLPEYLKTPESYEKVQKAINKTLAVGHSHSDMKGYSECKVCTEKMLERRLLLKRLGFKNPAQFKAWQLVHKEMAKITDKSFK